MNSSKARQFITLFVELIESRISLKDNPDAFMVSARIEDELVKMLSGQDKESESRAEDPHTTKPVNPLCPHCYGPMVARKNKKNGESFWGCKGYPDCLGTRNSMGEAKEDREDRSPEPKRWNVR